MRSRGIESDAPPPLRSFVCSRQRGSRRGLRSHILRRADGSHVACDEGGVARLVLKTFGAIRLSKAKTLPERLDQVFRELGTELERWSPDSVAIEEVFYSVNAKSALKLGQVRGVALLAAARKSIPVAEYAPLKIKSSVVGYGMAGKEQVQFMVARLLGLDLLPQPADAADALAIAICHIHTAQTLEAQGQLAERAGR